MKTLFEGANDEEFKTKVEKLLNREGTAIKCFVAKQLPQNLVLDKIIRIKVSEMVLTRDAPSGCLDGLRVNSLQLHVNRYWGRFLADTKWSVQTLNLKKPLGLKLDCCLNLECNLIALESSDTLAVMYSFAQRLIEARKPVEFSFTFPKVYPDFVKVINHFHKKNPHWRKLRRFCGEQSAVYRMDYCNVWLSWANQTVNMMFCPRRGR